MSETGKRFRGIRTNRREEYEAEKRRLKDARTMTGLVLHDARHNPESIFDYAAALNAYCAAQGAVKNWIHTHGRPSGIPSRAERRKAKLRRWGITPVWDR